MLYDIIEPLHDAIDKKKVDALAIDMTKNGWTGGPVLTVDALEYEIALTGTHRIAAAKQAEISIPTYPIDQDVVYNENDREQVYDLMRELLDACDDEDRLAALTKLHKLGVVDVYAVALMKEEVDKV